MGLERVAPENDEDDGKGQRKVNRAQVGAIGRHHGLDEAEAIIEIVDDDERQRRDDGPPQVAEPQHRRHTDHAHGDVDELAREPLRNAKRLSQPFAHGDGNGDVHRTRG